MKCDHYDYDYDNDFFNSDYYFDFVPPRDDSFIFYSFTDTYRNFGDITEVPDDIPDDTKIGGVEWGSFNFNCRRRFS